MLNDFLDFQFGTYHYPSVQIADSAICIAVGLYILANCFEKKTHAQSGSREQEHG